ncbi:hypothetical protein [Paraburkholderia phytofirmans]|jgi:hypothetical protein|uniref:Uncharacterized protein n=1 Tax=Paraburkholderia phytofirmans OLGA172 TaxID=1417228 RepID=A0A160FSP6_9BURK|nr:hypothetical protein [Paraburkholderia phytofirmans]ANB76119.1 hypothetical protein AYM40_28005 [Paraburkholderia phytofirmans OLGA172]
MAHNEFAYRRFLISATISSLQGYRGIATVDVTAADPERIADLGTARFLRVERWVERNEPAFLQVVVDECKVAIDHYADNVDDS